uniref:PPC domain-containing protein n=1 Tax=Arion vulgaris TaxID=1028688 RepID=A0A0B6ZZ14_9EUPU
MNMEAISGQFQCYPLRLHPGQEIYSSLLKFVRSNHLTSAFILTCVGSVTKAHLRMTNTEATKHYEGHFEIVSLVGTLSGGEKGHLHICLSNERGEVIGGHVMGDLIVYTTAEVMIGSCKISLSPDQWIQKQDMTN